jgi:hypothetical protein
VWFKRDKPRDDARFFEFAQKIQQLEEGLQALQLAHERLRGRFYQQRQQPEQSGQLTKAELLAKFVPRRS